MRKMFSTILSAPVYRFAPSWEVALHVRATKLSRASGAQMSMSVARSTMSWVWCQPNRAMMAKVKGRRQRDEAFAGRYAYSSGSVARYFGFGWISGG